MFEIFSDFVLGCEAKVEGIDGGAVDWLVNILPGEEALKMFVAGTYLLKMLLASFGLKILFGASMIGFLISYLGSGSFLEKILICFAGIAGSGLGSSFLIYCFW